MEWVDSINPEGVFNVKIVQCFMYFVYLYLLVFILKNRLVRSWYIDLVMRFQGLLALSAFSWADCLHD